MSTETQTNDSPVKVFRIGAVKASIWQNETDGRKFYSTKITRVYRDGEDWKEATTYSHDELLNVAKLAERAETYIERLQS